MEGVTLFHEKERAKKFLDRIEGKKPLFVCVIATTDTAKIPGLSAAGANPSITDFTPPADVELLLLGKCRCISGVPVTPDGIPTPALITMSALHLAKIPLLIVNAGSRVRPRIPFVDLGGSPGRDIRTGKAVDNVDEVLHNAQILGEHLADVCDYLVVGESIPGGTTTALGVLLAMGFNAQGKVSSSMPANPHMLKLKTVEDGLRAALIRPGDFKEQPLKAIEHFGDPMIAATTGITVGASKDVPVVMAGGTQMAPVLATLAKINRELLNNVAIGTTRWITGDSKSDIRGIVSEIASVPILAADLDFSSSKHAGLRAYEKGVAKEGVGAGGSTISAMAKSSGEITMNCLMTEIEKNYEKLVGTL